MKNILFISPTGTLDNGAEKSIVYLMSSLSKQGHQVYNVIPNMDHSTSSEYINLMNKNNIHVFKVESLNWWWENAPGNKQKHYFDRAQSYNDNIYEVRKIIKENNIDLVISNTVNVFQGALAAACENVSHFWLIHEFPLDEFEYYKEILPYMEDLSEMMFCVTGKLYEFLQPLIKNKSKIKTFIPYTEIIQSSLIRSESKRIVSIGRINQNKNQIELLHAYKALNDPKPELIFIGDYDEREKLKIEEYIKEQKLDKVKFFRNQLDPWSMVSENDVLVLTSKMETFGLVYLEALIHGVPTIISNNFGYLSVYDLYKEGIIYQLGDLQELSNKIDDTLANFNKIKSDVLSKKEIISEEYTIDKAYNNIFLSITEISEETDKQNILFALKDFIGAFDSKTVISPLNKELITVYYSHTNDCWSEEFSLKYPIEKKGHIKINLPDDTKFVRIDMSEIPSYYDSIKFINEIHQTQLIPYSTSGYFQNDSYYFDKIDPQLKFDVSQFSEKNFILHYTLSDLATPTSDLFLPNQLAKSLHGINDIKRDNEQYKILNQLLKESLKEKQGQLEEMVVRYNSVTHSRRWTIPTKIINSIKAVIGKK